jgi:tetratricopeptide (TPR) repeat protein
MKDLRADGWYEELKEKIQNFESIRSIMGGEYLAYSIILGVKIKSIITDPVLTGNAVVEFMIGKDKVMSLTLNEYKSRIVKVLIQERHIPKPVPLPLSADGALSLIGGKNILLAALFGISLELLVYGGEQNGQVELLVGYRFSGEYYLSDYNDLIVLIKRTLQAELAKIDQAQLSLDLNAVDLAREAAAFGDTATVIEALEKWPGLLSLLQRTASVEKLTENQLALIGEGVALLGEALAAQDQESVCEDLYRLGLQFVREGEVAARLFFNLGELMNSNGRFGEAIGFLRRALALGNDEAKVLPSLGHAFLRCEKVLPATALLMNCAARGFSGAQLERDLDEVRDRLALAGIAWNVPMVEVED